MLEVASDDAINISVNWSKLSAADKETYTSDIDVHLNAVKIPVGAISCKDTECRNEQHFEALNVLYEGLVGVLTEASKKLYLTNVESIATSRAGMTMWQICIRMLENALLCGVIMVSLGRVGYLT